MSAAVPSLRPFRLLRGLNLFGIDYLDVVLLAALADERPLLLIGPHGTAKSELLNRLAGALGLEHRHYNASLISFDDLLGYPVPLAKKRAVEYLRTPGDLWDAESVFLDEISRCRPETQNKLFSIVHEKRVQGQLLPRLRYRWAAMNPPLTPDTDPDDAYEGSIPLDPALADRFAYIVELPALHEMEPAARLLLIRQGGQPPAKVPDVRGLVERTRAEIHSIGEPDRAWVARYVDGLVSPLTEARLAISGRRAVMLAGSVVSIRAAAVVLGRRLELVDCAQAALRSGLPQRGQGKSIDAGKLTAIHRAAVAAAGEVEGSPLRRLRGIANPVARVAQALRYFGEGVDKTELSTLVSETHALLPLPRRYLFARQVLPRAAAVDALNAPACELLADLMGKVTAFCVEGTHSIGVSRADMPKWNELTKVVGRLGKGSADDVELANVLLTIALVEKEAFEPEQLVAIDAEYRRLFEEDSPERAAA